VREREKEKGGKRKEKPREKRQKGRERAKREGDTTRKRERGCDRSGGQRVLLFGTPETESSSSQQGLWGGVPDAQDTGTHRFVFAP
jgi:hypothetical protein